MKSMLPLKGSPYFTRRKVFFYILTCLILFFILFIIYRFTDILSGPPKGLDSNSRDNEWAMFRRDLLHSGSIDSESRTFKGHIKWVFSTQGPIHSSPSVANGIVYVGSRDGHLYALEAETGMERWRFKTGSWVESSPAVVQDIVYVGSNDGYLYAIDAKNGTLVWRFYTEYPVKSSPAVADDRVYFGTYNFSVYAVDRFKGKEIWRYRTGNYVISSPLVVEGVVFFSSVDSYFYGLDARNGRLRIQYRGYTPVFSSPTAANGVVYFNNNKGALYALDTSARNWPGETKLRPFWNLLFLYKTAPRPSPPSGFLWRVDLKTTPAGSSPLLMDDILYLAAGNGLFSVNIITHESRCLFRTNGLISASPAIAKGIIYVASEEGLVSAIHTKTSQVIWQMPLGASITSSPAVGKGALFIGSDDGKLYAVH